MTGNPSGSSPPPANDVTAHQPSDVLPAFEASGYLPVGDYEPSRDEFERRFVNMPGSSTRPDIYKGFRNHRRELVLAHLPLDTTYLLNGSYTTSKLDPEDIDLVVELEAALFYSSPRVRQLLDGENNRGEFRCDAYPVLLLPPNHRDYQAVTANFQAYWRKWFGEDRAGVAKGRVWATLRVLK